MKAQTLSILLVVGYLCTVKVVAYLAHKRNIPTSCDFFIANRSISCFMLVGTILATIINTLAVTGVPALVYKGGVLFAQMWIIGIIAPALIYLFGTKVWAYGKKHEVMTQGELFGVHYRSNAVKCLTGILGLFAIFPFMAIQLSAIGKVFSAATSEAVSYETALIVSAASIGGYLYFGGSRAVVWTDVVQALCFLAILVSSAILFTFWSGGYAEGIYRLEQTIPEKLQFSAENTQLFIDNVLSWPFAFFLWPQVFQRMFMAKSEEVIKRSVGWNFLLFNLVVLCTMTMGIMATGALHGELSDPDQLVAMMYQKFFPIGGAFIVVAVFATGMSTVDSILLTSSSIFNRDVLHGPVKGAATHEFKLARYTALLFLALVTCFALSETGRGAMAPLVTLGASIATLFLWPLVGMFYWKSATSTGVLAAMSSGFIAICLTKLTPLAQILPFGPGTAGFTVGFLVFITVSSGNCSRG